MYIIYIVVLDDYIKVKNYFKTVINYFLFIIARLVYDTSLTMINKE